MLKKTKKASGFSTVIGFLFTFFVLISVYVGVFTIFQEQVVQQKDLVEKSQDNSYLALLESDFEISSPFYDSGRVSLILNNTGSNKFYFKEGEGLCINVFINNNFVELEDLNINILANPSANYKFIKENSYAILSFIHDLNTSRTNQIKVISCSGDSKEITIEEGEFDWFNNDWENRQDMNARNLADDAIVEYHLTLNLNSTNSNFSELSEEEIRFVIPTKEQLVLDLSFDNFNQELEEFSKYSNTVVLGLDNSVEARDPTQTQGVFFNALSFDGTAQHLNITNGNSISLDEEFTISTWLKWEFFGDSSQNIFFDDDSNSNLRIINDGGQRDLQVEFNLNSSNTLFNVTSNQTLNSNWNFITITYNKDSLSLYQNGVLVSTRTLNTDINLTLDNSYLGFNGVNNFLTGSLDEFKIYNFALNQEEIEDLYHNDFKFKELKHYTSLWKTDSKRATTYVKTLYMGENQNVSFQMYYNNPKGPSSTSDIEETFSFSIPRTVAYIVNERVASTMGLDIISFYDSNIIQVDNDEFNLDNFDTATISSGNVEVGNEVRMKDLAMLEGSGSGGDMVVPASWASTEFNVAGHRNSQDRTCIYSPFADATITLYESGSVMTTFPLSQGSGTCHVNNTGTSNVFTLESTVPVVAMYYGDTSDDAVAMLPFKYKELYGSPTNNRYIAAGANGAQMIRKESDGDLTSVTLASYSGVSTGSQGTHGTSSAQFHSANNPITLWQQGDGDGAETTTFIPEEEMGTLFGSASGIQYLIASSPNQDANCSTFTNSGILDTNTSGVGESGIFKYGFEEGSTSTYINQPWILRCDKPVMALFEKTNSDETNTFGHVQMRQFIHPEPEITLS